MRELWQKLTTGLKDYCRENGFRTFFWACPAVLTRL